MAELNILRKVMLLFGGWRAGRFVMGVTAPIERAAIPISALEDDIDQTGKGTYKEELSFETLLSSARSLALMDLLVSNAHDQPVILGLVNGLGAGTLAALYPVAGLYTNPLNAERNQPLKATGMVKVNSPMAAGTVIYSALETAGTGAGAPEGDGYEVGALGDGQRLVAILSVVDDPEPEGTGTELAGTIESDVDDTFATPVTRITFDTGVLSGAGVGEFNMPGAVYELMDGDTDPVTDTFWRFVPAVTGSATPLVWPVVGLAIVSKEDAA